MTTHYCSTLGGLNAESCPFCHRDPYHYEDVGVGFVPVGIVCCETMVGLNAGEKPAKQILLLRRRGSPKSVARANRIWYQVYGEGPIADKE